ncbi:MAG: DUF2809 domain-containing protein [Phycisphaerales bacterium]
MLRTRWVWAVLAAATIGGGLLVRRLVDGPAGKHAGVALYAVMMVWLVLCIRPRTSTPWACIAALLICWMIEGAQATGLPVRLQRAVPGAHLVLGEVFAWSDMAWYGVGVLLAGGCLAGWRKAGKCAATGVRSRA